MPNILFLSDNEDFRTDLSTQIELYADGFTILDHDEENAAVDMILLDEKTDQFSSLRQTHPKTPIVLFQKNDENVSALANALTSIIIKPFALETVLNQIRAGINILENSSAGYLTFNKYIVRPVKRDIYNQRNREVVKLTEKEVAIIKYLYKCRDRIVTKNELLQEVWGYSPEVSTHTIETHIYRLRQKVEHEDSEAQLILTEEGGYRLKI